MESFRSLGRSLGRVWHGGVSMTLGDRGREIGAAGAKCARVTSCARGARHRHVGHGSRRIALGFIAIMVAALSMPIATAAHADTTCEADDFAAAIDRSGVAIRTIGARTQPEISKRMSAYGEARGMSGDNLQEKVFEQIYDSRIGELDKKTSELLFKIDRLGRPAEGAALNCADIAEIDASTAELVATIDAKSQYVLTKLGSSADKGAAAQAPAADASAAKDSKAATTEAKPTAEQPKIAARETTKPAAPAPSQHREQSPPLPKPSPDRSTSPAPPAASGQHAKAPTEPAHDKDWNTATKPDDAYVPPPVVDAPPGAPLADASDGEGYSIDEVREVSRGFFGTISTGLASVIEHAFQTSGRPTAYVLGTEGGGAFLAGLRYGKGKLYMRHQPAVRDVYWHGPSLGTDVGASGSRTLFLIYSLDTESALYRSFTGVDGSAYFVGGVGLTLLKGGDVVMAPIRSGLGFRFGANIGYLRFTPRPTWNPF